MLTQYQRVSPENVINQTPQSLTRSGRIPLPASTKQNSPTGIKNHRTTISQATINRLATPKHVTFCFRTPTKLPSIYVPERVDSAMSTGSPKELGWDKEHGWDVAVDAPIETPDETPDEMTIVTKQYDSDIADTSATQPAAEEDGLSYARFRENLFEVLQSATIPELPIWISLRASQRASELREEHQRSIISA